MSAPTGCTILPALFNLQQQAVGDLIKQGDAMKLLQR
jgi:hypothetical protein